MFLRGIKGKPLFCYANITFLMPIFIFLMPIIFLIHMPFVLGPPSSMRLCGGLEQVRTTTGQVCQRIPNLAGHEGAWPSGLRRWLQVPVREGMGAGPAAVIGNSSFCCTRTASYFHGVSIASGRAGRGRMRLSGVEPGAQAWEACMLPLHYRRT